MRLISLRRNRDLVVDEESFNSRHARSGPNAEMKTAGLKFQRDSEIDQEILLKRVKGRRKKQRKSVGKIATQQYGAVTTGSRRRYGKT
jgi:hypothetical protein